jgi:hypothetical protein
VKYKGKNKQKKKKRRENTVNNRDLKGFLNITNVAVLFLSFRIIYSSLINLQ